MSSILDRLAAVAAMDLRTGGFLAHTMDTAAEAKREIERLSLMTPYRVICDLERYEKLLRESSAEMKRVEAENKRLRDALKPFAEIGRGDRFGATPTEWKCASAVYTNTSENKRNQDGNR